MKLKTLCRSLMLCAIFTFGFLASLPQTQASDSITKTFPTVTFEGTSAGVNINYTAARTASQSQAYPYTYATWNTTLLPYVGQFWDGATYEVWRAWWTFDTHTMSITDELVSALLKFKVKQDHSTQDFDLHLNKWLDERQAFNKSDFSLTDSVVYGSISTASLSLTNYNTIQLTSLSVIQKGGYTTVCLRSSRDANGNTPSTDEEYVVLYSTLRTDSSKHPVLEVTYNEQGGAGGPREDEWVPLTIPNIPLHARRVLEWVQQQFREREELRAVVGLGLIMVVGGVIVKWDKGKRKLQL